GRGRERARGEILSRPLRLPVPAWIQRSRILARILTRHPRGQDLGGDEGKGDAVALVAGGEPEALGAGGGGQPGARRGAGAQAGRGLSEGGGVQRGNELTPTGQDRVALLLTGRVRVHLAE